MLSKMFAPKCFVCLFFTCKVHNITLIVDSQQYFNVSNRTNFLSTVIIVFSVLSKLVIRRSLLCCSVSRVQYCSVHLLILKQSFAQHTEIRDHNVLQYMYYINILHLLLPYYMACGR